MTEKKSFQIRLPKDLWTFLKKQSMEQEKAMNVLIIESLQKMKKSLENKLT